MTWHSFLSYSRQQYYSAESLVLQLQGQGLSIWFDVQQLEPGTDWQQDIQAGIEQSGTLLLLASRAALASPYVRREWQRALELGHPAVVALLENARLPRELRHGPVIDLRGDFDAAALRVQQAILDPKQPTKPVWPLPVLPRGVRQAAFALFLNDVRATGLLLLSLALWIMLFRYASLPRLVLDVALKMFQQLAGSAWSLEQFVPWLLVGGLLLVTLRLISAIYETRFTRLLRRDIKRSLLLPPRESRLGLPLWLWLALASGYLDMVTANYTSNGIGPAPLPLLAALAVVFLLLWRLNRIAKRLLPHLPNLDLLRWAVVGGVPDDWRTQLYRGLSLTPLAAGQGADLPAIANTVSSDAGGRGNARFAGAGSAAPAH